MDEYKLGQYNQIFESVSPESGFMTILDKGVAGRISTTLDLNVTGPSIQFDDEMVTGLELEAGKNYYFHGKIKRRKAPQTFNVKLINYSKETSSIYEEQFIIELVVASYDEEFKEGDYSTIENSWADVEFIFSPVVNYDTILFQLVRTSDDFINYPRNPKIAYEELSLINNNLNAVTGNDKDKSVIKIGVQSRPGLLMCINGESIRTSKTGIYEIKNGIITVSFFSVCFPCAEANIDIRDPFVFVDPYPDPNGLLPNPDYNMREWMYYVNKKVNDYETVYEEAVRKQQGSTAKDRKAIAGQENNLVSKCFFNYTKTNRQIDAFTLDYLYYMP